jgi:predicted nuclease of predicted toxin-antitoxin system
MNLVADESVDLPIVLNLRLAGHDVVAIPEFSPSIDDDRVLHEANSRNAVLITADKDFGELVHRLKKTHHGVILLRLSGLTPDNKVATVIDAFTQHSLEFAGAFVVIAPGSVRIRR